MFLTGLQAGFEAGLEAGFQTLENMFFKDIFSMKQASRQAKEIRGRPPSLEDSAFKDEAQAFRNREAIKQGPSTVQATSWDGQEEKGMC